MWRGRQPGDHQERRLVGEDVEEHPARQAGGSRQPRAGEVQAEPELEARAPEGREQGDGLGDDPEGGAGGEEDLLGRRQVPPLDGVRLGDRDEQQPREDEHDVVEHGGPHRWREAAADVEDGADERPDAVEEDLRQEEAGEEDRHRGHPGVAQVEGNDRRGERDGEQGDGPQPDDDQGQQALGVGLAGIVVPPRRGDEQGDDDAGEHPAQQELVDDVGNRVGGVVRIADHRPDRHPDDEGAQKAGSSGRNRPERHAPARSQRSRRCPGSTAHCPKGTGKGPRIAVLADDSPREFFFVCFYSIFMLQHTKKVTMALSLV